MMPIKIYIDKTNRPKTVYVQMVKNALDTWKNASGGLVDYICVEEPSIANVKVSILGIAPKYFYLFRIRCTFRNSVKTVMLNILENMSH